ncbi:membrane protein [Luteimonas pelagia]
MDEAAPQTPPLSPAAKRRMAVGVVVLASLAFGAWGLWKTFAPQPLSPREQLGAQADTIEELEQRVATLSRSDQITRDAMRDLQSTLAERDEEIAGLRADVDFYERFVGSTAQRRGLTVHELRLQPREGNVWHFTATLTQNLNRGAVNRGELDLAVEGTVNGRLQRLDWTGLRQDSGSDGIDYSFRYFQEVEGDINLPEGMQPVRVHVRLQPANGSTVQQSFDWAAATGTGPDETG